MCLFWNSSLFVFSSYTFDLNTKFLGFWISFEYKSDEQRSRRSRKIIVKPYIKRTAAWKLFTWYPRCFISRWNSCETAHCRLVVSCLLVKLFNAQVSIAIHSWSLRRAKPLKRVNFNDLHTKICFQRLRVVFRVSGKATNKVKSYFTLFYFLL